MFDFKTILSPLSHPESSAGVFLKYNSEYDEIQKIRREDVEFFPSSMRPTHHYHREWIRLCDMSEDILENKSKDFQVAVWLLEGLFYTQKIEGILHGIDLMKRLMEGFWEIAYPRLDEDLEYRLAPFIWLSEKFVDKLIFLEITNPSIDETLVYTFADYLDLKRLELLIQKTKNPAQVKQDAENQGKASPESFKKAKARTDISFFEALLEQVSLMEEAFQSLDKLLDQFTKNQGVSFVRIKKTIAEMKLFATEAVLEKKTESEKLDEVIEEEIPQTSAVPIEVVYTQSSAYSELEKIAKALSDLDPRNPAPYLIRKAIVWGNMRVDDFYADVMNSGADMGQIFKLLDMTKK